MIRKLIIGICCLLPAITEADEGMWIPSGVSDSLFIKMQQAGLKLKKSDLYNADSISLIDAIPQFGYGCSSGVVSNDGLIITNYHCARYFIQQHSTVNNNLLDNGFVAEKKEDELPNKGLSVTFTRKIIDVSNLVLKNVHPNYTIRTRDSIIEKNIDVIEKHYTDSTHLDAQIERFFYGTQYLLYLKEEFKDIRLVYSPPSQIAEFGGEKDNWQWPRHSADFAIFRIYTDSLNKPATFSNTNKAYTAQKVLTFSLEKSEKGHFCMVIGYPGTTEEYLTPQAITFYRDSILPAHISLREKHLSFYEKHMNTSAGNNLYFRAKYASVYNYYTKWKSDYNQLKQLAEIRNKKLSQILQNENCISQIDSLNKILYTLQKKKAILSDGILSLDIYRYIPKLLTIIESADSNAFSQAIDYVQAYQKSYINLPDIEFYQHLLSQKEITPIQILNKKKSTAKNNLKNINFDYHEFCESLLIDSSQFHHFIKTNNNFSSVVINDIVIRRYKNTTKELYINNLKTINIQNEIDSIIRTNFVINTSGIYPDANYTIRESYGTIQPYLSKDAVLMDFKTTVSGISEKKTDDTSNYKFKNDVLKLIPPTTELCFISNCHTTGGNSGSPVLNSWGQCIGINFDRNIEGTLNDYLYQSDKPRNISVSSQYIYILLKLTPKSTRILSSMHFANF